MSDIIIFTTINYFVSFISDIVLNILSVNYIRSLHSYFKNQNMIKTANDAGITVVIALLLNIWVSSIFFGFTVPTNYKELGYFCFLAFVLGYFIDIFIYKAKIFGNRLNSYYEQNGAGFWGALAFVFSIVISYFIQKMVYIFKIK